MSEQDSRSSTDVPAAEASPAGEPRPAPHSATPGAMIRAAREAKGMHLTVLSAATKVPRAKLEALEADRLDAMPDVAYTRALAHTVCRVLGVDPAPVLAGLPAAPGLPAEAIDEGLKQPFRQTHRPSADSRAEGVRRRTPLWAGVGLGAVVVAALLWWAGGPVSAPANGMVTEELASPRLQDGAAPAASGVAPGASSTGGAASERPAAPASAVANPPARASTQPAATLAAPAATGTSRGSLRLEAQQDSWVEVVDADNRTVFSRSLGAGESVAVQGTPPLKLVVGNAAGTRVSWQGAPVDLASATRENVARVELR